MQYQVNALDLVADVEPIVIGLPLCPEKNSSLEYVILAGFGLSRKVRHSRHCPQYVILHAYPLTVCTPGKRVYD